MSDKTDKMTQADLDLVKKMEEIAPHHLSYLSPETLTGESSGPVERACAKRLTRFKDKGWAQEKKGGGQFRLNRIGRMQYRSQVRIDAKKTKK